MILKQKIHQKTKKKEWSFLVKKKKEFNDEINKLDQETVNLISAMKIIGYDNFDNSPKAIETHKKMCDTVSKRTQIKEECDKLEIQQLQLAKDLRELIDSDSESSIDNNETSESSDSEYEAKARKARNVIKKKNSKHFHFRIKKN